MKYKELISTIAERESKKVETPVGNIREIVKIMKVLNKETGGEVARLLCVGTGLVVIPKAELKKK